MKNRNQIFNYLYAMAIIMVIDDHVNTRIGFLLNNIFPYNSFYMPLFIFGSGYFFEKTGLIKNILHKIKKLLVPYVIWNMIAYIITLIIDIIFNTHWLTIPNKFNSFLYIYFIEPLNSVNSPAWFVIMLFWTSIIYNALRNILKLNKKNDTILTILLMIAGFAAIQLCIKGYNLKGILWLAFLRTTFYIQFYHYGYIFKEYIEQKFLKLNKLVIAIICVIVNIILTLIFGEKINYYATAHMGNFTYWYLPLITSITGITFYYILMEFLSRKIGQVKIIDFIARNTFVIMETHLFFLNIPNFYVYNQILQGSTKYADFNIGEFMNGALVRYNSNARLIGFVCGIVGSLLIALLIEKCKKIINNNIRKIGDENVQQ